ncbi:hypothetical protein BGX34_005723 [Mortierella sp. NVP85]|nr:hypothetical protein BGX34_005723 [Mortierella sp. NVP85]
MSALATIFFIPHLMDMICHELQPEDIKNCVACCKDLHYAFGPYRFRTLEISVSNQARLSFLKNNGHHIRVLTIAVPILKTFDGSCCTSLQKLELLFMSGDAGEGGAENWADMDDSDSYEEDEDEEEDKTAEHRDSDATSTSAKADRFARVAELIQKNKGLQALYVNPGRQNRPAHLKSLSQPILNAIKGHYFLTKIELYLEMTCLLISKLLNHLPPRLEELEVNAVIVPVRNHSQCDIEAHLLRSRDAALPLRRLIIRDEMCTTGLTLIHLLKRCPELEDLHLPFMSRKSKYHYGIPDIIQLVNSYCKRLFSLSMFSYCPVCHPSMDTSILLQKFSRGYKQLHFSSVDCRHDVAPPRWPKTVILEKLLTTPTVNTLEVLEFAARYDNSEHIIGILKHCPRMREFLVYHYSPHYRGMDALDLLVSMEEPWKCQNTLEVLHLRIYDPKRERTHPSTGKKSQEEDHIRQLNLRLDSFPRLTERLFV